MPVKRFVLPLLFILFIGFSIQAQSETLSYGSRVVGSIKPTAPLVFYPLEGAENDLIEIHIVALTPDFQPTVTLLDSSQQPLATSELTADGVAYLSRRLTSGGVFFLLVGGENSSVGEFVIHLTEQSRLDEAQLLSIGESLTLSYDSQMPSRSFSFDPNNNSLTLSLSGAPSEGVYQATLYDAVGKRVVMLDAGTATNTFSVGGAGLYQLDISAQSDTPLNITVSLTGASAVNPPATGSFSSVPPANVCSVTPTVANVNLRSGDDTAFALVGSLSQGNYLVVNGKNAAGTWYNVTYNNQSAWVFADLVTTAGDCANLAIITAPQAPQVAPISATPTAQASPTSADTQPTAPSEGPTLTYTPTSEAPTATMIPTATSMPEAPTDSDPHTLNADRDTGGTFSQVISYPNGDTSDRVVIRVNLAQFGDDSARTVNVQLSCSGTGTQNVRFTRTSPNAQQYNCGDTISFRYAYPQSEQTYYVFITSGEASYVNYTLTVTTQP